jgi:hypothetical protein
VLVPSLGFLECCCFVSDHLGPDVFRILLVREGSGPTPPSFGGKKQRNITFWSFRDSFVPLTIPIPSSSSSLFHSYTSIQNTSSHGPSSSPTTPRSKWHSSPTPKCRPILALHSKHPGIPQTTMDPTSPKDQEDIHRDTGHTYLGKSPSRPLGAYHQPSLQRWRAGEREYGA